jgi:uncharacterized membrane protein YgdD (TMEM256/DUF423 family)
MKINPRLGGSREMDRTFLLLGSIAGALAVAVGAFGAHALRGRVGEEMLNTFEIGARYQMYHALALLAVAWVSSRWPGPAVSTAGWLFVAGIVLFSGSLYLLALTGQRWLGAVTPLGGLCFLGGWILLAWVVGAGS